MSENIIELGRHDPTVESVTSRLSHNSDKIKSITAVVTWDDGSSDVYHETKKTSAMTYEYMILQKYLHGLLLDRELDEE